MEEFATTLASSMVTEGIGPAGRMLKKLGKEKYDEFIVAYTNAFKSHLEWADERTQSVKNMIYRDRRALIEQCYVATDFRTGNVTISDIQVLESIKSGNRIIISGTAGAGKTMTLKWAVQELLKSKLHHSIIPIVIDIKDITEDDLNRNFAHYIYKSSVDEACDLTFNQFLEGFKQGLLCIFIDAVDEIPPKVRHAVIQSIHYLGRNYKKVGMLVTTRPDERLELGIDFQTLHTCPLNLHQAISVVEKIEFDQDTKVSLIADMKGDLFEKHKSFLSNPLLITIMLLTYNQWANVPIKFTNYYKLAFEALFQRHDATKSFTRKKHTDLEIDEFRIVFSHFCYRTYIHNMSEFSLDELYSLFKEAIDYFKTENSCLDRNISSRNFSLDCVESTCLLQRDGLLNVFSHRTFQEYFTARFCCDYRGGNFLEIVEAALSRGSTENIFPMMHEIDQALIESKFVIPFVRKFIARFSSKNLSKKDKIRLFLKECINYMDVDVKSGEIVGFSMIGPMIVLSAMASVYPSLRTEKMIIDFKKDFFEYYRSDLLKSDVEIEQWKRIQESSKINNNNIHFESNRVPNWITETHMESYIDNIISRLRNFEAKIKKKEKDRNSSRDVLLAPINR